MKAKNFLNLIFGKTLRFRNRASNVCPHLAANDFEDGSHTQAEFLGQTTHVEGFAGVKTANVENNAFRNLVVADLFSFKNLTFRPTAIVLGCTAAFLLCILHVVLVRSEKQVSRIATGRIVALVADVEFSRITEGELVGQPVGLEGFSIEGKLPIAKNSASLPLPTFVGFGLCDKAPEFSNTTLGSFRCLSHVSKVPTVFIGVNGKTAVFAKEMHIGSA